jgi:hypothetical protein
VSHSTSSGTSTATSSATASAAVVSVASLDGLNPGDTTPLRTLTFRVTFSYPVAGVVSSDLEVVSVPELGAVVALADNASPTLYSFTVTLGGPVVPGALALRVPAGVGTLARAHPASPTLQLLYAPPQPVLASVDGLASGSPTALRVLVFTLTFSAAVSGVGSGTVTAAVSPGLATPAVALTTSHNATTYTFTVALAGPVAPGTVTLAVPALATGVAPPPAASLPFDVVVAPPAVTRFEWLAVSVARPVVLACFDAAVGNTTASTLALAPPGVAEVTGAAPAPAHGNCTQWALRVVPPAVAAVVTATLVGDAHTVPPAALSTAVAVAGVQPLALAFDAAAAATVTPARVFNVTVTATAPLFNLSAGDFVVWAVAAATTPAPAPRALLTPVVTTAPDGRAVTVTVTMPLPLVASNVTVTYVQVESSNASALVAGASNGTSATVLYRPPVVALALPAPVPVGVNASVGCARCSVCGARGVWVVRGARDCGAGTAPRLPVCVWLRTRGSGGLHPPSRGTRDP